LHARRSLQKSGCNLQHRAKEQQQQPPQPHIVADMRLRFAAVFCFPRGFDAPRSWCRANVCRRKTIFAMHERTFTRAASVSPPWV
jgi:hypothetical protein